MATMALRRKGRVAQMPLEDRQADGRQPHETDRIRAIYDRTAGWYDAVMGVVDWLLFESGRGWLGAQAHGDVLEVGIGTGRNLHHYGEATRIIGVDMSRAMLRVACRRAPRLGVRAALFAADAQTLALPDGRFDCVVFSLSLCSIPDPGRAVREAVRVVRPGGSVIALEHVRSDVPVVRLLQRLLDPLTVRALGDHLLREPLDHLPEGGLVVETVSRTRWGIVERVVARRTQALSS